MLVLFVLTDYPSAALDIKYSLLEKEGRKETIIFFPLIFDTWNITLPRYLQYSTVRYW